MTFEGRLSLLKDSPSNKPHLLQNSILAKWPRKSEIKEVMLDKKKLLKKRNTKRAEDRKTVPRVTITLEQGLTPDCKNLTAPLKRPEMSGNFEAAKKDQELALREQTRSESFGAALNEIKKRQLNCSIQKSSKTPVSSSSFSEVFTW